MRWTLPFAAALAAHAADPFDIVEWEDLKLRPDANFVYFEDRLILHPRARLTGGYDSNSTQRADSHDEGFIGLAAGGTAVWLPVEDHRFQAEGILEVAKTDRYESSELPLLGSIAWDDEGEPWLQHAEARVRRNDSPSLVQTGRQVYRNDWSFGYDGTLAGDVMSIGGGPLASRTQFLHDALEFEGDQRDQEQYALAAHWGWQRGPVSLVEASASVGALRYDEPFAAGEGPYADGRFVRGQASWNLPIGERTSLRLAAGASAWRFTDAWGGDPARDDQRVLVPEGSANLHWGWEEDSFVEAHVTQDAQPGVNANLDTVCDAGVFGRLAILQSWGVDGELGMTRVTASSGAADAPVERRWGYRAGAGAELYYATGWLWRVAVNYSDSRARIAEPFARTISMVQVTVAY